MTYKQSETYNHKASRGISKTCELFLCSRRKRGSVVIKRGRI